MRLHQIQSKNKNKKRPRVGRGGRRGTYSGRGQKGQRSRAGHKIRPAIYDIIGRLPKLRGYKNKPIGKKSIIIKTGDLEKFGAAVIDREFFKKDRWLKNKSGTAIKILGVGEIKSPLQIKGVAVSRSAKKKIESAGGSVQ